MEVCLPIISCKDTIFFRNISNFFQSHPLKFFSTHPIDFPPFHLQHILHGVRFIDFAFFSVTFFIDLLQFDSPIQRDEMW